MTPISPKLSRNPRVRHLPVSLLAALLAVPVLAQQAPAPAPAAPAPAAQPVAPADQPASLDKTPAVVKLSPFEVNAEKDSGYYTANTLAGTRLNNNIADLPSSISVITKQQLDDTASININDVFRYEANTEGAHTYTPFALVRSNLQDGLGGGGGTTGNYTSAIDTGNRVRGLSTADQEEDNFFSLYRIPFDSYNTQAVEIDRGPNSIIFGTGSPAGIVNQERIQADPSHASGDVTLTGKSWGGYRESFNANVPIIKDRLAIFLAQVYDSEGFKQKPSSDITRRGYAAFTLSPFANHKTKLTGSIERYENYANDPNGITPVDFVSPWLASGQPTWNPVNDTITYQTTGHTVGPYAISNAYPNYTAPITQALITTPASPYFVPSLTVVSATHNIMFVDQGNLENFFRASQTGYSVAGFIPALAAMTNAQKLINEQRMTTTTNLPNPAHYQTWYFPGVVSKDIYDWSTINVNSLDNTTTQSTTYNLSLQQEILPNLNVQVAWFRQDLKQLQDAPLAQANATTLYVDTNSFLPNGQPNPHVGQPYVDVYSSDVYSQPETNNNWRFMLDYEPDFRGKVPSWLNWLGHHRLLGVYSQHDDVQTALRYRPAIDGGDPNYLPTAATLANATGYSYPASNAAIEQWFYLGGPTAAAPGHGTSSPGFYNRPGFGGPTSAPISTYNYATGQWGSSSINMDSLLFATGGLSENLQDSKTFFWQSFFWDDRIVGSVGVNQDKVKNRSTLFPTTNPTATLFTAGFPNSQYWYKYGPWSYINGTTHTRGAVVHPFKGWTRLDNSANGGNYLSAVLRTLSFTVNKSDNFNPPPAHYTDYFGNDLGKPQGKEKDWGLEIATPDNKFFLRATWFNTTSENAIVTLTSTARANYIDQTELKNWATKVVEVRNGQNPSDPNFGNINIYPITQTMQDQIAALTGLPYTYGGNVGETGEFVAPNATESGVAKGTELEFTYNPTPNWTMRFTWGKQQTTITGAAAQAQAWVNHRSPAWQQYAASDLPTVYTLSNGTPMYLGNFWQGYGYDSNVTANNINGWTTTQNYYNIVVGSQLAIDEANNGTLAPNQREYHWSYLSNYTFDHGPMKHLSFGGALRYDGRATAGYYGDEGNLNSTGQVAAPDVARPIYTPGRFHIDAWVAYTFKMPWARDAHCKLQLNVADLTSNGYLLPVTYNFDGSPAAERIIEPRSFTLSAKFAF
jgi:outer membrane receptor protein involved in Fe transport